jgi:cysteine protease ATG4
VAKGMSVLVMIPIRLGLDSIQQAYLSQIKKMFDIFQNVGIAGGRDHLALYLVGIEDSNLQKPGLFYLDPHFI